MKIGAWFQFRPFDPISGEYVRKIIILIVIIILLFCSLFQSCPILITIKIMSKKINLMDRVRTKPENRVLKLLIEIFCSFLTPYK